MRLLKVLLTALFAIVAVTMGLFAAAIVGLGAIALLLTRKLLRGGGTHSTAMQAPAPRATRPPANQATGGGDVIEVTATEVPADR